MKKIRLIVAAAALISVVASFTSCGGNDNKGMTDGTVTVGMNDSGRVSDVLDGSAKRMR
ncbi:MAG: hypothetical protein IJ386_08985 [Clostridia bacterium]|nr:hypothetical protein [Clostridia bacterium]